MKLEKGKYINVISYGTGRHFLVGPTIEKLTIASKCAIIEASTLNKRKNPRAPVARVTVMRIVEVYDGKS